ncbi:MAG: sugar ABC transporter substrate-binding protein, partial [Candidatus Epulonipiscium fishelsonii]
MKKRFLALTLSMATLTACGGAEEKVPEVAIEVPQEVFGSTIKYDPSLPINDGEDIELDFWIWGSPELFQSAIDQYSAIHPNVSINLVNNPWDSYWTKLPLSLNGDKGPALFNIHNSHHENLINYLAPLEIPLKELQADFVGVDAHIIDDEVYYIDYGIMTGSVFYNKNMWEAASLTEADIPTTWDELREVAKKLTIKEGDQIVQAGLNFNGDFAQNYLLGVNYQLGENLFLEDGITPNVTSEATKQVMQMLVDMYEIDGIGHKDFGEKCADSFGQEMSAMVLQWGHFNNTLNTTFPDINYGVFEIPSFDGNPYAYNRYNGESTFGINKNASASQQAVAQDFMKFFLASDEVQVDFNLAMNTFPSKTSIADNEEILNNPAAKAIATNIDRYIWPGPMPATMETSLIQAGENIFFNGMSIDEALEQAQENIVRDLQNSTFVSVENLYK